MGVINAGIRTIATRRAEEFRNVEKISSEVTESAIDDAIDAAVGEVYGDEEDDFDDVDLSELEEIIPDSEDSDLDEELGNILDADDEYIDIDDMLGIDDPEEELAMM